MAFRPAFCLACKTALPARKPGKGRPRLYCSAECQQADKRQPAAPVSRICFECGRVFRTDARKPGGPQKYCSPTCRQRAACGGECRSRWSGERRIEIFDRDGWICQICGGAIDSELEHPDLMAATIDHRIARSAGGSDERHNVQASHFLCNIRKRSPIGG